jgi:hypothetical protein
MRAGSEEARALLDRLNPAEYWRVLGCAPEQAPPEARLEMEKLLEQLIAHCEPRHAWAEFPLHPTEAGLALAGTGLVLPGRDVAEHLQGCTSCAVMAATLGIQVDRAIDGAQRRAMAEAVMTDALASALIEAYCDLVQARRTEGRVFTWRYSPGYGDLPLGLQPKVLAVLDAGRRMGLHCTASNLLIPRKSVTAVLGLLDVSGGGPTKADFDPCARCQLGQDCELRKAGRRCGR